jgi:hypothetical protein
VNKFNCEENQKKKKTKKNSIASWTGLILKRKREKREIVVREMIMRLKMMRVEEP